MPSSLNDVNKWFIVLDYEEGDEFSPVFDSQTIQLFDMAILDPDHHPPLEDIKEKILLIAYISVGEAEDYRFYWDSIKEKPWIIGENPNWQGNYYVDIRNQEWQSLIIEEVIPRIIQEGFKGLMLDTLDTAEMLEEGDWGEYPGSNQAMQAFVRKIHETYPELYLISNNGFSILNEIAADLSGVLVEDIHWMVDFQKDSYQEVPRKDRKYKINILKTIKKKYSVSIFNIDYVAEKDHKLREWCVEKSQKLKFKPYVAEKDLDKVYF